MDSVLLDKEFFAENCIRSFTTPTFVPSLIYSISSGSLAVACYEKFIRKDYFLPYLYFGNAALLYAVSHIFLIIFVVEERDSSNEQDFSHTYGLYASLIISAFGSYFINLASFRLLEKWVRSGQNKDTYLSKYSIAILSIIGSSIPVLFTVTGDIMLTVEANKKVNMVPEVQKALVLKLLGAVCNLLLSIGFISLFIIYSWSAYINNTIEKAIMKRQYRPSLVLEDKHDDKKYIETTFRKVVIMLLSIGILTLIRFTYELYIVIRVIVNGPIWDVGTCLAFIVADGIILPIVVLIFNLTAVKELIVYTTVVTPFFHNRSRNHNRSEEIIPFSRSPMALETSEI